MSHQIKVEGIRVRTDLPPRPKVHNPLNRPAISYKKPVIAIAVYVLLLVGLLFVSWIPAVVWTIIYVAIIIRKAAIWVIHLYQSKAPDNVRLRCVFEPSCSEYAIIAIKKYGFIVGGIKTIGRLRRCHFPNGGQDYP